MDLVMKEQTDTVIVEMIIRMLLGIFAQIRNQLLRITLAMTHQVQIAKEITGWIQMYIITWVMPVTFVTTKMARGSLISNQEECMPGLKRP